MVDFQINYKIDCLSFLPVNLERLSESEVHAVYCATLSEKALLYMSFNTIYNGTSDIVFFPFYVAIPFKGNFGRKLLLMIRKQIAKSN